jgi:hypothetical protein
VDVGSFRVAGSVGNKGRKTASLEWESVLQDSGTVALGLCHEEKVVDVNVNGCDGW